jgi:Golgi nucleoside diphosphatase
MWIGAYGKQNIAKSARIARSLKVNPICIVDFDVLSATNDSVSKVLIPIVNALGGDGEGVAEKIKRQLHNSVDSDPHLNWVILKRSGIHALENNPQLHKQTSDILKELRQMGLFVIPSGEMESLHTPKLSTHGTDAALELLGKDIDASTMTKAKQAIALLAEMIESRR